MMRSLTVRRGAWIALPTIVALAFVSVAHTAPFSTNNSPPGQLVGPKPERVQHTDGAYIGKVSAIGVDWIELGPGWEGERTFDANGQEVGRMHDNTKAKRISTAGTKPGGNPDGEGEQQTHLVSHLKAGDKVIILVGISANGEEWTTEIRISRRPGGKIPPQHGDPFVGTLNAFHLRDQAEQDWEEQGTPIPAKNLSNGRATWTNPPYPPSAPMPREVRHCR
jgi:hypothetical protein